MAMGAGAESTIFAPASLRGRRKAKYPLYNHILKLPMKHQIASGQAIFKRIGFSSRVQTPLRHPTRWTAENVLFSRAPYSMCVNGAPIRAPHRTPFGVPPYLS